MAKFNGRQLKDELIITSAIGNVNDLSNSLIKFTGDPSGISALDQSQLIQNGSSAAADQWQSITPGVAGYLDKVAIENRSGVTATGVIVSAYDGIGSGGALLAQETGITINHGELKEVIFTTKAFRDKSQQYSIGVSGANWGWGINTAGGYPGGTFKGTASDAVFKTFVDIGSGVILDSTGTIFNVSSQSLNLSNIPLVLANVSAQVDDVTGDGTLVTLPCDNVTYNHGGDYNNLTFIFTARVTGMYEINPQAWLRTVVATHTTGILYITTTSQSIRIYQGNPANERDVSDDLSINGSVKVKLFATDTVECQVVIAGNPKSVDIGIVGVTQLAINLISTT